MGPPAVSVVGLVLLALLRSGFADDEIDSFVRSEMERQQIPGVSVVVVHKGHTIKATGYGLANLEHRVPVGPSTVFESSSIGKQFTAVAVMLQVEAGKLSLDDSLRKFFPSAPANWSKISVRHLLNHTSGIPNYTDGILGDRRDYDEDALVRLAFGLRPEFPPGSRWKYSNTGYVLLGIIVRKVSGQFYGDVLCDRVFAPLQMKTARVISEEDIIPNRFAGYRLVNGILKNQEWVPPRLNTAADGSLYLSALDLAAWETGIRTGSILRPESRELIFERGHLNDGTEHRYGFGWFIDDLHGQIRQHHSGEWQGFSTYMSRYVGSDLTVAVLANLAEAKGSRIVEGITERVDSSLKE